MSRFSFKLWLIMVIGAPIWLFCCFMLLSSLANYAQKSQENQFARVAEWANEQTAVVLANDHQWDLVRVIAMSKDGFYIYVQGVVENETALKVLRAKLENPQFSDPAPVPIFWDVQVKTNGVPQK